MSPPQFDCFFQAATKKPSPYDYQRRLACGERNNRPEAEWLASSTECNARLINKMCIRDSLHRMPQFECQDV